MFTGIVEKKSPITRVKTDGKGMIVSIKKPRGWKFALGDSVSIDGICSTVIKDTASEFSVMYMDETIKRTTCSLFDVKTIVNLERSLKYGDRVHGHLVQGHVSSVATVLNVHRVPHQWDITLRIDKAERRYISYKGSITIDGVSLTVAKKTKDGCMVSIIPHTADVTTLGLLEKGDTVNIETDFLLRAYLAKS